MLQIQHIKKEYRTGTLVQKALDDVSLNLRDNEFVAILGPSGSGKTTLLNIIGGLDRYDSGDLIINGISTKKYKDRDWDSYRNHTIGFVFQSYNLIPHQTVLANVELAMTISGISGSERRRRATEALEKVGLGAQLLIRERGVFVRQGIDLISERIEPLELMVTVRTKYFFEKTHLLTLLVQCNSELYHIFINKERANRRGNKILPDSVFSRCRNAANVVE